MIRTSVLAHSAKIPQDNGSLDVWYARFNEIKKIEHEELKDKRLANLMNDLQLAYNIPMLNNPEFNKSNPEVIKLYRKVSRERAL